MCFQRCGPITAVLVLLFCCAVQSCRAIKLRVQNVECVHERISEPNSLVSVVLVAGEYENQPVYFDFVVRFCTCSAHHAWPCLGRLLTRLVIRWRSCATTF
jgi:hypothetical protein